MVGDFSNTVRQGFFFMFISKMKTEKMARIEIVTRNKWENISALFTRLEEGKPFSQDCSSCQTDFLARASIAL